jgi:hypothetical protein
VPESWVGNEQPGPHLQGVCPEHGIVMLGPRSQVLQMIAVHYAAEHGGDPQVLLEGKHFVLEVAPMRCDICLVVAEPPWWKHTTSRPLLEWGDADGLWLLCDTCHATLGQGHKALLRRVKEASATHGLPTSTQVLSAFVATTDDGVRNGI